MKLTQKHTAVVLYCILLGRPVTVRYHHKNTKPDTTLAFLNADWYDFESTPADEENPDKSITIFGYQRLLTDTGWKIIRRIECPLSTERQTGNMVQNMQDKRILGTIGRTLLIAKKL